MEHHHQDSNLTFEEKMIKLVQHWIAHNHSHAQSYQKWAEQAEENGLHQIVPILNDVAESTRLINNKFEAILRLLG